MSSKRNYDCEESMKNVAVFHCDHCGHRFQHITGYIYTVAQVWPAPPLQFCHETCHTAWKKSVDCALSEKPNQSATGSRFRIEEESRTLEMWESTAEKMTEVMKESIKVLLSDLEQCLKFGNGRIWLGLQAHTLLADRLYGVNWMEDSPDRSKGRRQAIEHTKRKHQNAG